MDAGFRLLAAKYLRKQAKQLRAQYQGIRNADDIEFIHRARVATRRLRAGLKLFQPCFSRQEVKKWKTAVARAASDLGDARDKDVQIEFLRELMPLVHEGNRLHGLSRLLVHWEHLRDDMQPRVLKAIERLHRGGELVALEKKMKRVQQEMEKLGVCELSPDSLKQTRKLILARLAELLQYDDCLERPDDRQRHHAMRIAAKRLRYTIEISSPLYAGRLEPIVDKIKRMQTLLGDIHDCDVWQDELEEFAVDQCERLSMLYGHVRPFEQYQAGMNYLREERRRFRDASFRELVGFWRELQDENFFRILRTIVQPSLRLAEETPIATVETTEIAGSVPLAKGEPAVLGPASAPLEPARADSEAPAAEREAEVYDSDRESEVPLLLRR